MNSNAPQAKPSLWKTALDVWPFIVLTLLCGVGAYMLHLAGSSYESPNSILTTSTLLLMGAGAAMIATAFGLVHLGVNQKSPVIWGTGAVVAVILAAAAFFVSGATFAPGFFLGVALLVYCGLGWWLGTRADFYRAQFPGRTKFLGDWD